MLILCFQLFLGFLNRQNSLALNLQSDFSVLFASLVPIQGKGSPKIGTEGRLKLGLRVPKKRD